MSKRKTRKLERTMPATAAQTAQGPRVHWKALFACIGIVALLVAACYTNTLFMGIVYNDPITFMQLHLTDPGKFFQSCWTDAIYRPLTAPYTRASFALDAINYGPQFGFYHLVNVFLQFAACAALFCLVFRLVWRWQNEGKLDLDPYRVALASALVYACHPLAAQSATYISARYAGLGSANFLLAANFFLLGLLGKSGAARWWGALLTVVFGGMSLASSEVGLLLPATLLALFFMVKPTALNWKMWAVDRPFVCGLLVCASLVLPFIIRNGFGQWGVPDDYGFPQAKAAAYYATQAKAFATYYTRTAFVPIGLSIDPPYSKATGWADLFSVLGAAMLVALLVATRWLIKRPVYLLGVLLIWSGLIAHLTVMQQELVADPVVYLSLAGFATIIGAFCVQLWNEPLKPAATKFGALLLVLIGLTVLRNLDFRSDETLIAATLRTNPYSAQALSYSAIDHIKKHDFERGLSDAKMAINADPDMALAYYAKGSALLPLGKLEDAQDALDKAQTLAEEQKLPIVPTIKLGLAEVYMKQNKPDLVNPLVYQALVQDPNNPRALYLIGSADLERNAYGEAYMYLQRAAQLGVPESLEPLSQAALKLDHYAEAMTAAEAAIKFHDTAGAELAYGNAALAVKQNDAAEKALTKAAKMQPDNAQVMALLSILYERKGDKVLAESYHKDALQRDPEVFSKLSLPGVAVQSAAAPSPDAAATKPKRHRRRVR